MVGRAGTCAERTEDMSQAMLMTCLIPYVVGRQTSRDGACTVGASVKCTTPGVDEVRKV